MTRALHQESSTALNVKQVAATLGVSGTTVHNLITAGELRAMDIGTGKRTHWRVDQADLDDYREKAKERTRQRLADGAP